MVISLSGYDGMGKSTSVDLLMEKICENHGLKGMSALKANNGTEVYENIEQVDDIYKALSRYDVITTRFYFRSNKMQKLQEMVMFAETDVFDNTELIKEVTDAARQEAQIWYDHVIGKLLRKNKIIIYDRYPILGGTPKRGKEILSMFNKYAPNTKITSFLRPEYLDDEYLELLSRSSIEELRFGIQTINESVPNWIRANNISKILKILPLLTSTGIPWRAELIVGLPGDDIYGLKRSIEFVIKEVHPTYLHAYHLSVLKETEMYSLLNNPGDKWIKIYEDTMRAKESYSYSEKELIWMVQYAVLITALYNMYASVDEITGKAINEAPEFAELEKTVMEHMGEFVSKGLIHYSDGEKYWAKVKSSDN